MNHGTVVPLDLGVWKAKASLRALPATQAYWLSDVLLGTIEVPADPSGYVVIGRHESCDVVLDDALALSLRHVIVRAAALDDGFSVLSVMDRVHVLLIREAGCCHLYDVASLVGTFAGGTRVRCLQLADEGTSAHLAARGGVTLHWRALGE